MIQPKPFWLKIRFSANPTFGAVNGLLEQQRLHTVCRSARCPNLGECWSRGTATFMIMGDVCTRNCRFCNVQPGAPLPLDPDEPRRVAEAAKSMNLRYVVVTSVTRDDLPDGGAAQFAAVVRELRRALPEAGVEILVPDFRNKPDLTSIASGVFHLTHNTSQEKASDEEHPTQLISTNVASGVFHLTHNTSQEKASDEEHPTQPISTNVASGVFHLTQQVVEIIMQHPPDVLNHNIETVPRLYPEVRPRADYHHSLNLLKAFAAAGLKTKSGLMVGMGETLNEIHKVLLDLRANDVKLLTIGQYLRPSAGHYPVERYVHPDEFAALAEYALALGFEHCASAPLVRSSYRAEEAVIKHNKSFKTGATIDNKS
ncbi:MAG: lipoyl synthase [Calditrichaeota bacterium]|nr:lipoyl synthase [Calditrichota bacterium]